MKNIFQHFEKLLDFLHQYGKYFLFFIVLLFFSGFIYLLRVYQKEIIHNLESTTKIIEAIWFSVTRANEETMRSLFEAYILNKKTLQILRKANSPKEEEQNLARAELYRHLGLTYENFKKNYLIRQLQFHTPNNRSFLRFHAPYFYGDDLTPYRPTVVMTNKLKKPHIAFEIGRLMTGYRYVYPIIDEDGTHLGSVEFSRSFEAIRRYLSKYYPEAGCILVIRKKTIMRKVFEPYKRFYQEVPFQPDWVLEDPYRELEDTPNPLSDEYEKVFLSFMKKKNAKDLLESKKNITINTSLLGKHYKITLYKLFEPNIEEHTAVLLTITPGKDIELILKAQRRTIVIYILASLFCFLAIFVFWKTFSLLKEKHQELEMIVDAMGGGLIILDNSGLISHINEYGANLLQYNVEELLGKPFHKTVLEHKEHEAVDCPLWKSIVEGTPYSADTCFKRKDGTKLEVYVINRPIKSDTQVKSNILLFFDISERKKVEHQLLTASITDFLTGLYNRRFIKEELLKVKKLADRYGPPFSVIMIDIDNFKAINDKYGHKVGDQVLKVLATVLKVGCRTTDIASRWGGEEFLILLPHTNLEGALKVAERLRSLVETLKLKDIPSFTISLGVSSYNPKEEIDELIKRADQALYEAKKSGKNSVKFKVA